MGLWLFPFGLLIFKSGFLPAFLGILLFLAGGAYVFEAVTWLLQPGTASWSARPHCRSERSSSQYRSGSCSWEQRISRWNPSAREPRELGKFCVLHDSLARGIGKCRASLSLDCPKFASCRRGDCSTGRKVDEHVAADG